jgi:hypothetical protein
MPQAQMPGSKRQLEETPEEMEGRNRRSVEQARLDWITRPTRVLEFRLKWKKFYRENTLPLDSLLLFKDDTQKTIQHMTEAKKNPHFLTAETWTKAAEMLEEAEAQLEAIEDAIKKELGRKEVSSSRL